MSAIDFDFKLVLIALALLATAVIVVGLSGGPHQGGVASGSSQPQPQAQAQAQAPAMTMPPQPKPRHPEGDIRNCLRCHVSPKPLPEEEVASCVSCHQLRKAHRTAPRPIHPVKFSARARECYLCHNPHYGPRASEHAASAEGLCAACHLTHDGLAKDAQVESTCAQCHNLGLPADHPSGEGPCERCHEEVLPKLD